MICAGNTDATVEAGSGEEVLEALGQQPADLVITDIHMDGHGLLDKVKEQFPQLPVLAISGVVDVTRCGTTRSTESWRSRWTSRNYVTWWMRQSRGRRTNCG